jgi:hypothetical protein
MTFLLGNATGIGPLVVPPESIPRPGRFLLDVDPNNIWAADAEPIAADTDIFVFSKLHAKYNTFLAPATARAAADPVMSRTRRCSSARVDCLLTPELEQRLRAGAACGVNAQLAAVSDKTRPETLGLWQGRSQPLRIAMHLRRGDIATNTTHPWPGWERRFLPDEYYFDVVEALRGVFVTPNVADVLVFTEPPMVIPEGMNRKKAPPEAFYSGYMNRSMTVHMPQTADLLTATAHFIEAHILVQGLSTLSLALWPFRQGCLVRPVASFASTLGNDDRTLYLPTDDTARRALLSDKKRVARWLHSCLAPELRQFIQKVK